MPYLQDAAITTAITLDTRMLAEVELSGGIAAVREVGVPPIWNLTKGGTVQVKPILLDGALYFGAMDGVFYAVGLDGRERWRFATQGMFFSDPLLDSGLLIAGCQDHRVYALRPDGSCAWSFTAKAKFGAPVVAGRNLYVAGQDGICYALGRDGSLVWAFAANGPVSCSALVHEGTVAFCSWDKSIYGLDEATGHARWRFSGKGLFMAEPAAFGPIGIFGDSAATVYAIDLRTGQEQWRFACQGNPRSVTRAEGLAIIGTYGNRLHALDPATGAERWCYRGPNPATFFTRPGTAREGVLYIPNTDSRLYAIRLSDGAELWSFTTKAATVSTPLIADGRIYFGSYDCNLYCITLDGQLVWAFPTSMSTMTQIDVDSFRREHGKEQTFVLSAPVVEVSEERYKERRGEDQSGAPGFSTYVQKSTYTTKSKYA